MRGIVFLFIALLFALPVMAQEVGSISGTVSTEDGNPVAGAGVAIWDDERNHMETRTDEDGAFAFERVPAGSWNISASMEGMEAAQDQIEVSANENTEGQNKSNQQSTFQANDLRVILKDQNHHYDRGGI